MARGKTVKAALRAVAEPPQVGPTGEQKEKWKTLMRAEDFTPGVERSTVLLTPEAAADWIKVNVGNRPIRRNYVKYLANVIRNGGWIYDANPIRFDTDGNLIDGQHRLMAVIEAGIPVPTDVVANLDPAAKNVVDTGVTRTMSDVLHMREFPYAAALAAVLRVLFHYYGSRLKTYADGQKKAAHTELLDFFDSRPEIMDSVKFIGMRFSRIAPASAMGSLHYVFAQIDRDAANQFFEDLHTGAGLTADDPVLVLREKLSRGKTYKTKGIERVIEVMALTIKAWNYRRQKRTIKSLFWRETGPNGESFPEPI